MITLEKERLAIPPHCCRIKYSAVERIRLAISDAIYAVAKWVRPGFREGERVFCSGHLESAVGTVAQPYPNRGWHDQVAVVMPGGHVSYWGEHQIGRRVLVGKVLSLQKE